MVYDRVDDGDKFSKKNFGLGRLRFHATSGVHSTGPEIINCFCLHGIFTGNVSSISNKCDQCIL